MWACGWIGGKKSGRLPAILPLERASVAYQPISFFRNLANLTLLRPFVKRSPSWSSELIWTNWIDVVRYARGTNDI